MGVRHQFGNEDLNIGVFSGEEAEFSFDCPNVSANDEDVLLFQGNRVGQEQTLKINGSIVFGGIPSGPIAAGFVGPGGSDHHTHGFGSPSFGWSGYVMLVSPNVLRNSNNLIRAASRGSAEFIIDNMVLFYRTRGRDIRVAT
jgi:hypothetical protein